jgi:hypothetical protein
LSIGLREQKTVEQLTGLVFRNPEPALLWPPGRRIARTGRWDLPGISGQGCGSRPTPLLQDM